MAIQRQIEFAGLTEEQFERLDYVVTGLAFQCHRCLGRLADEDVYKRDLLERVRAAGLDAHREVGVKIIWRTFSKQYSIDLVIGGAIYEAKTTEAIVAAHEAQTRSYLILAGATYGKIFNFRPASVQRRFVTHHTSPGEAAAIEWRIARFVPVSDLCPFVRSHLAEFVLEFGSQLTSSIYAEALCAVLSPQFQNPVLVPMERDGICIGNQRLSLITPNVAVRITSLGSKRRNFEQHLLRLIGFTRLKAIHWIDITRHVIELTTIKNHSAKSDTPGKAGGL